MNLYLLDVLCERNAGRDNKCLEGEEIKCLLLKTQICHFPLQVKQQFEEKLDQMTRVKNRLADMSGTSTFDK